MQTFATTRAPIKTDFPYDPPFVPLLRIPFLPSFPHTTPFAAKCYSADKEDSFQKGSTVPMPRKVNAQMPPSHPVGGKELTDSKIQQTLLR